MENTIEIEGQLWHSKKSLMDSLKIKKSLFYEYVNDGRIIAKPIFTDAYFRVYRLNEIVDD